MIPQLTTTANAKLLYGTRRTYDILTSSVSCDPPTETRAVTAYIVGYDKAAQVKGVILRAMRAGNIYETMEALHHAVMQDVGIEIRNRK